MTVINPLRPPVFDNRGALHYPGDQTANLLGQIFGPTLLSELIVVDAVSYDPDADMTTGRTRPANQNDLDSIDPADLPYPRARTVTVRAWAAEHR